MNTSSRPTDERALEARLAARLIDALAPGLDRLPHDVTERLRFAREQALARARQARLAGAADTGVVVATGRSQAVLAGFAPWWRPAASLVPLVLLLAGLVLIDDWVLREQVMAAADIDTQLLADDLPPAAYSDPGFAEYLRSEPAPP